MKNRLSRISQPNFTRGINLEPETARQGELLNARNVWVQNGELTLRPGTALRDVFINTLASTTPSATTVRVDGTASTAFYDDLDGLAVGKYVHLGWESELASAGKYLGPTCVSTVTGGTALDFSGAGVSSFAVEYWDGNAWQPIDALMYTTGYVTIVPSVLNRGVSSIVRGIPNYTFPDFSLIFPTDPTYTVGATVSPLGIVLSHVPEDMVKLTLSGAERFWIRLQVVGEDLNLTVTNPSDLTTGNFEVATNLFTLVGGFAAERRQIKQTIGVVARVTSGGSNLLSIREVGSNKTFTQSPSPDVVIAEQPTWAVIPEFNKVLMGYGQQIYDIPASLTDNLTTISTYDFRAKVSNEPFVTGPGAPYDPDPDTAANGIAILQATEPPKASYIMNFRGYLWAAGIKDDPFKVQWSGAILDSAYNVWPDVSFEQLSENDNSPITGLASLNEHPVVFKRDSIWLMVLSGFNELGLAQFRPVKVVSGIGTVSNASIAEVNGRLIFLAEDGFYMFDGTPNVRKLSDRIDDQVAQIVPSKKIFSTGVHWRTRNVYMCSCAVDGSAKNNFVFVYDYSRPDEMGIGAWWFWDGLEVNEWFRREDKFDKETILFGDSTGMLFELTDMRYTDAGKPIAWEVLTHRMGYGDGLTKRWNDLRFWSNNDVTDFDVDIIVNDTVKRTSTLNFKDTTEAKWGTGLFGTAKWSKRKRRERFTKIRETGEWMQLRLYGSKRERFQLYGLQVGITPIGYR